MNLEKLINMVVNQVVRKLVNLVVDRGVNMAAEKMKPSSELTEEEKGQGQDARQIASRAQDIQKASRKIF